MKPLDGLRILDLTRLLPGGFCTMLLSDLGADVIKVEQPGKGDHIRWMPPDQDSVSAGHLALNRGKRSITLDLKQPDGVDVLKRLAHDADVLVDSFRPGVLDRLGIGWDVLHAVNERLIMCAITGYGQDGPYRDRAGHDINYLGYAGVLDIVGEQNGPPVVAGVQIADIGGGALMAAVGILSAVAERARTGLGRFVDISMLDGAFSWLAFHGAAYAMTGETPARGEMRLSGRYACYTVYQAADGAWLSVGALEPQFWAELCRALELPELIERQFQEPPGQNEVIARLEATFASKPRAEWLSLLESLDACVGPVKDLAEAYHDPQLLARGMVVPPGTEHRWPGIGNPVLIRDSLAPLPKPAPLPRAPGLGEHTDEVLRAAGYSVEQIDGLRARGVI